MSVSLKSLLTTAALFPVLSDAISLDMTDPRYEVTGSSIYSRYEVIGDIDSDQIADVLIDADGSLVLLSGADGSEIYRISDANLGQTVDLVGDLNADGIPEILATGTSFMALYSGRSGEELTRTVINSFYGYSRMITDVTGDGFADVVTAMGFVFAGTDPGYTLEIRDGTTLAMVGSFRGIARSSFAEDLTLIDDVNNDGIEDLAVTAGTALSETTPEIFIYSGATLGFLQAIQQNDQDSILFARRIIPAGDFDGDGVQDIAIAGNLTGGSGSAIEVYSVADGSLLRRFDLGIGGFEYGIATGSFDEDDVLDFAVGLTTNGGVDIRVIAGSDGSVLRQFTQSSDGFSLIPAITAADFDGNGLTDLLVSRYDDDATTGYVLTSQSVADTAQDSFLSGGWFDPAEQHANEGVFLEFAEHPESGNPAITAIWYGYAQDGSQKWYIGGPAELSDEGQARVEMFSANGAQFGDAFDSASVQRTAEGDAIIHIGGCDAIDFRMYFESGDTEELQLIPLLRTNLELDCADTATSASAFNPTGIWWNADRAGEGFFIDTVDSDMGTYTFSSWFAYADGQPAWVVAGDFVEANDGNTALPAFTSARTPENTSLIPFGELRFDIASCTTATATYASIDESAVGTQSGTIELTGDFTGDTFGGCQTP